MNKKRKAAKDPRTYKYRHVGSGLRDTNKLAILNVQTAMHLALNRSGRDGNAYLIGQQRVQSMLQTRAKSRTIPGEINHNFASRLPVNIRNLLDPG
jgi:hypothetical protein